MDIYYFYHPPQRPRADDWDIWNLAIPLKGARPAEKDAVLLTNASTLLNEIVWVGPQDDVSKWPHPPNEKMMQYVISAVFKADYSGL
jgi:hypothetical protein